METKPIVTCHGDQTLFSTLHPSVLHGLPKEATEWKRSYGRPSKTVHLEASFVPYDEDILPVDTDKTLISRPYFHIFWTGCDLEAYKQTVREDIMEWHNGLKSHNIPDWLIVVVVSDESKVKTKLLPRASVIDKVRSDFCSKQPDRCIVLMEPMKSDQRSMESWVSFQTRLRQLLLQAFNRHLNKYEESMRGLREKRNEPGWNFHEYFLVQEELAFMFEMLGLMDEALLQYDELDALFSQFIVNKQPGTSINWLIPLVQPCSSWAGLSLRKPIDRDKRDLIKSNHASLLQLRNYLFSRQCALLMLLQHPWEVAQRAAEFLHETVQEVKLLQIQMPQGSLDCWAFLSCLEILQTCEQYSESVQVEDYSVHTAGLWDFARNKLRCLGDMCGLEPGSDVEPSSEQLSRVIDLTSGMGIAEETDLPPSSVSRPRDRLREAISSKDSFQKIYLELSELAMGTFKHIGRFRCSRVIGRDLANFYMKLGMPQKAEGFLLDALKSYHQEGWKHLADGTRLELARCQQELGSNLKYVRTACQIASSPLLKMADRQFYMNEVLRIASSDKDLAYILKASPLFQVITLDIKHKSVTVDQEITMELSLINMAPEAVIADHISLALLDSHPQTDTGGKQKTPTKKTLSRQTSDGSLKGQIPNLSPIAKQVPVCIGVQSFVEGKQGRPFNSGIACNNTHEVLRRIDSASTTAKDLEISKDNFENCLCLSGVSLIPGENVICLKKKVTTMGCFQPSQLSIQICGIEFLTSLDAEEDFSVICDEPYCDIVPVRTESILAGVQQEVLLKLHTGSFAIAGDSKLRLSASRGLTISVGEEENRVTLESTPRNAVVDVPLKIFLETKARSVQTTESKITCHCESLEKPVYCAVTFTHPFRMAHKLYTCKDKKYLQIMVHGNSPEEFELSCPTLQAVNTADVELLPLNKPNHLLKVNAVQNASYVWQVKPNVPHSLALDMMFTVEYLCSVDEERKNRQFSYACRIEDFQTMFSVSVNIRPLADNKVCQTGEVACLEAVISRMPDWPVSSDQQLMYDIAADTSMWAFCGKTSGVFSMGDMELKLCLDAVPLVAGYLPLPRVNLFKYSNVEPEERPSDVLDMQSESEDRQNTEMLESNSSEKSETDAVPYVLEAFPSGQVYSQSIGMQVHVFPKTDNSSVEVTVIE